MNKQKFILELSQNIGYSEDQCIAINKILEENFFISRSKKDIIINKLEKTLSIHKEIAISIYKVAKELLIKEIQRLVMY